MPGPASSDLLRADRAPAARTLVDVVRSTIADAPDEPALDNGATVLTYAELGDAADELAAELHARGIGPGHTVGVRIDSGTVDLYVAILGVLVAGAAYVPVDVDDPDARARTVFDEAEVAAVVGNDLTISTRGAVRAPIAGPVEPQVTDDAWVIFTSGSTGTPKGVAVSHRSAAAFVDAEARLFLQDAPLGLGDRVMAGLSVAFDASCEEIWLAWGHGACLVPAPRSLVKSGTDLGPWLVANDITVVSTVPTLVSLWPTDALDAVRLLILGGEACPPEIGARLASDHREVWNTYGPTEATVVACAARVGAEPPVRIGVPLDGWDLVIVGKDGVPVEPGEPGELIIGGVGLARYLDPVKDAEKYAPMPTLGWDRAYRSGDQVRDDGTGLIYLGRGDEQIKIGGRRIELGEVDSALLALDGVEAAAAAVRRTAAGNTMLVGYVATRDDFDPVAAVARLRADMPAALVPRLARLETLPTRTSGKIDRDALPWPLPDEPADNDDPGFGPTEAWLAELWRDLLGASARRRDDDFFAEGGGSLTAAQLVARLRERFPEVTVAHVYENPTVGALAAALEAMTVSASARNAAVLPVPLKTQSAQVVAAVLLRTISGARWLTWVAAANHLLASALGWTFLPQASWWWIAAGWLLLVAAPGRMLVAAAGARFILSGVSAGEHPRGGKVHLRLWLAERFVDEVGAGSLSGATLLSAYARLLGAHVGPSVDLHSIPPVTGLLHLGDGSAVEPEVDLSGHWIDGGTVHIGPVHVGTDARVGVRSMLAPGARVGDGAEVAPGSVVFGAVPDGEYWSGAPATSRGQARGPMRSKRPPQHRRWVATYAATAVAVSLLPIVAIAAGVVVVALGAQGADDLRSAAVDALAWTVPAVLVAGLVLALLVVLVVRVQSVGLDAGTHPVHGASAWRAWTVLRVMDDARTWLFPLYSSTLTPAWLRLLGARIGHDVEASTVLMLPSLSVVNDGAFLADDTMLGMYELGGGWLRVERVKVGRRAFIGNSGMTAPGRKVPKDGLVAVLSAAPRRGKAKAGTSWLGSPPTRLRRAVGEADVSRTYAPAVGLRVARAVLEVCRLVAVVLAAVVSLGVVVALDVLVDRTGWVVALLVSSFPVVVAGLVAALVTSAAKWALVGRVDGRDHPLWSSFVWRNELADAFVEVLAAPWFARWTGGTPLLTGWLRSLGARIGPGVWCESYWLPEPDLIDLEAGATVNRGCVVQTHLFHDRILSMDTVTLRAGATLGPHSVILPAATLGRHATVGPVSLVMRGESVPPRTRWIGNPIGPWADDAS